jgi:hypothetical protein
MIVNRTDKNTDKLPEWERALFDVQREIGRAEMRARLLRNSAKIIRSKIEAGEPWPGTQSDHRSKTAAT